MPYWPNTFPIKKAQSLRAASLSKLKDMGKNNSIFNKKCAKLSTKW